ncbi:MAG: sensor domain-containing diguanylate cyclase [Gemmatimonadaceae bacterium]|nr:sensor domain-containing diguanylate cyclase [Gemmatimonadaceae bacterium]
MSAPTHLPSSLGALTPSGATVSVAPPVSRRFLILGLLALGYFATALGGLAISRQAGNVATLWPPNGMLVAALMLTTRKRWGDVLLAGLLGSLAANIYNGNSVLAAGSITLANLAEALIAATIIRRRTGQRLLFQRSSDVVVLILASIVAAVVAGALSATSAMLLAHAPFTTIFIKWVLGDLLGLLVVMPIAIIVHDLVKHGPDIILAGRTQAEATLVMAAVVLVSVAVYSPQAPPVQFLVMPTVLLASYRLGPFGAAMSTTIVAVLGSVGTAAAAAAVASSPYEVTLKVFNFQLNLAVLFLTALPIGSAMAQRSQLEADLLDEKERADRYAADMAMLVNVDDLTGLSTRRHLLEELDRLAAAARRAEQPLTLAMIDIDHFKPINDQFGHAVGDAVLMAIGAACRSAVRSDDVIGRLGGEEFAMLMPLTDQESAFRIVDRLRESVAAIAIPVSDGRNVSVTISVGVATFVGQQIDRLLLDADRALYAAKEMGRNRIVVAERGVEVM